MSNLRMRADRTSVTVIEVGRDYVVVQHDHAKRVDGRGMSDAQTYEFSPWPEGPVAVFKRSRDGSWRAAMRNDKGRVVLQGKRGNRLVLGHRSHYHDFSF